jgi:hypothetical protein
MNFDNSNSIGGHLIGNQFTVWNCRDLSGNALNGPITNILNSIFGGKN